MFKNVASQKIALFVYDSTTGAPKTGDGANLTPYVSKDYGTVTVLGTTTATEMDATNAKGWYSFVLTQAETNGDALLFTGKSSTANAYVVGMLVYSDPPSFSTLSVDGSGRVDVGKIGGTAQTARDIGASVITASYTGNTPQTGDAFARLGAPAGASVSADAAAIKSDTGTILTDVNTGAGAIYTRLGAPAGASIAVDVAAVKTDTAAISAKTTNLPASPAAVGSAMTLTSGERTSIADAMLDRDMSVGADSGSTTVRTMRQALRFLRNKFAIVAGTMTVCKEDDVTASWTSAITTSAGNPVSSSDPAGP